MKKFNIEKFNKILAEYGQQIRAIKITGKVVELSNGKTLTTDGEVRRCKKRVMNESIEYCQRFDRLYSLCGVTRQEAEKEARSAFAKKGGKACFEKHGKSIIENNLSSKPWNKGTTGLMNTWNKGLTKNNHPSLKQLSKDRIGEGNPMYGRTHSEEYKRQQSERMKQLIIDGKFTPNSNNRNTHWDSWYKDKKFRSSWEAIYQAYNLNAVYEELRIEYKYDGDHVYIVDFVDHENKIAVEVKPKELIDEKTRAKLIALDEWCANNGYKRQLITQDEIKTIVMKVNIMDFDTKTQKKIQGMLNETC